MIFWGESEGRLTVTSRCLVAGKTEEIREAARLIIGFLSAVGNKILITPQDKWMRAALLFRPPGWEELPRQPAA